jgi:molybdopterin-guanine dinucleotide biosynthesis protein
MPDKQKPLGVSYYGTEEEHNKRQFSALITLFFWIMVGMVLVAGFKALTGDKIEVKRDTTVVSPVENNKSSYDCHHAQVIYMNCADGNTCTWVVAGKVSAFVSSSSLVSGYSVGMTVDACNY